MQTTTSWQHGINLYNSCSQDALSMWAWTVRFRLIQPGDIFLRVRRYCPDFIKQKSKPQVSQAFVRERTVPERWQPTVGHNYLKFQHSFLKINISISNNMYSYNYKIKTRQKAKVQVFKHWHLLKTVHCFGNTLHNFSTRSSVKGSWNNCLPTTIRHEAWHISSLPNKHSMFYSDWLISTLSGN